MLEDNEKVVCLEVADHAAEPRIVRLAANSYLLNAESNMASYFRNLVKHGLLV